MEGRGGGGEGGGGDFSQKNSCKGHLPKKNSCKRLCLKKNIRAMEKKTLKMSRT